MIALRPRSAALALIFLAGPAALPERGEASLAAEEAASQPKELSLEELAAAPVAPGFRLRTAGKYMELQGDEIVLFESPARFVAPADLLKQVLTLNAGEDNVAIEAVCTSAGPRAPVFAIQSLSPAPRDEELFALEIERLESAGEKSAPFLFALAGRIYRLEKRLGRPELLAAARRACDAALRLEDERLPAGDVAGRLLLLRKTLATFADREHTMEALVTLEQRFPEAVEVRELLIALGARRFRGRWMLQEEFKRAQGFELHGNQWLTPREREFLEAIAEFQKERKGELILRSKLAEEYLLLAQKGETAPGMTAEEVAQALGFAERVYRKVIGGKPFDQWVYEAGCCYFYNGVLFRGP
jgi:hypothetical protein